MQFNALVHLAVEADDPGAVDKLLAKICAATSKQDGVVFAYATKAPSLTRAAKKVQETQEPEEMFHS